MSDSAVTVPPETPVGAPRSLDEVIQAMRGFGLEEVEEVISLEASGRRLSLRVSNVPTEQEMKALLAAEEYKGYAWVQRIRCEILSRAITWVDGVSIRQLPAERRLVVDPTTKERCDIQVALRNILLGWGTEVVQTLWKLLMVHSDKIEKRMQQSFPDSALTTEVERRFYEAALQEIRDAGRKVIEDTMDQTLQEHLAAEKA